MRLRVLLIVVIVAVTCWFARHFAGDDALIYARYVRNALHGDGMVFNPGEHVNALTSPLYSLLLLVTSWLLGGHILIAEFLLCGLFLVAACVTVEQIVPWSGVLVASTSYFYYCIGLETCLFLFLLSLLVFLFLREQINWLPLVALLAMLTRMEGMAMAAAIALQLVRKRRWPAWQSCIPVVLLVTLYLWTNHELYGKWLPSSATAKIEQGLSGLWGRWPTAFLHVRSLRGFFLQPLYAVFAPVLIGLGGVAMWQDRRNRMGLVLLPFGALLFAFYVLFNLPNYHWYYAPFIFFALVYAVHGLPPGSIARVALGVAVAASFGSSVIVMRHAVPPPAYVALGNWIDQNTPPDATIAAVEIGTLAWYDHRAMDDLLGLTSPVNAQRLMHRDFTSWLPEQQPDYVVVHAQPAFGEIAAIRSRDYAYLPVHFGSVFLMKRIHPKQ